MLDIIVNIVTLISAPLATGLLAYKRKEGFLVFVIVEACYIYLGLKTGQFGIIGVALLYFVMNCCGYYKWTRDEKEKKL